MHMLSRKDLNSPELETVRESRNPTTVITANGEVQTNEEAIARVYDTDLLRPLGSQDWLDKLQNFGWSVPRPTVTLVTLACVSFHFIFPVFLFAFLFILVFLFSFLAGTKKRSNIFCLWKIKRKTPSLQKNKNQKKINIKERKKCFLRGLQGYLPRRLKKVFFLKNGTRNRATIEAKKKLNIFFKKNLDPKGRTPPFWRLTCSWQYRASRFGKLCEDHGYSYEWTSGRKPHLINYGRKYNATLRITHLSLFQACQLGLPARLRVQPSTSVSQDSMEHDSTPSPATTRSRSTRSWALADQLQVSTETETKKTRTSTEHGGTRLHDLPEWFEEFGDNSVNKEASATCEAPAAISCEPLHQELFDKKW